MAFEIIRRKVLVEPLLIVSTKVKFALVIDEYLKKIFHNNKV